MISAATSVNLPLDMYAQRRFISACAFAQFDQNLHRARFWIARDAEVLHASTQSLCWTHILFSRNNIFLVYVSFKHISVVVVVSLSLSRRCGNLKIYSALRCHAVMS